MQTLSANTNTTTTTSTSTSARQTRRKPNKRPALRQQSPLVLVPVFVSSFVYTKPSAEDRELLKHLCYRVYSLSTVYFIQTISIWIRIKHTIPVNFSKVALLCAFNISVRFLGSQYVCSSFRVFTSTEDKQVDPAIVKELRGLHMCLLHYHPASHLQPWKVAKNIMWFIFLKLLKGRIQ